MILYYSPLSNYCSRVKFLVDYKNIEVHLTPPPGGYGSDTFKKISPTGTIPTLKHGNIIISESEIINEYLNDLYPNPAMLSNDIVLNAKIKMISKFHDNKLEPSIRFFFKFKKQTEYDYTEIINGFENVKKQLTILDNIIHNTKYIVADEITLADCSFPSWFALFDIFCDHFNNQITLKGKIKNYYDNLLDNKFTKEQYNSYYENALKWSKESLLQL